MGKWFPWILLIAFWGTITIFSIRYSTEQTVMPGFYARANKNCSFRIGPSETMPLIFGLYKDEKVGVICETGGWLYVQFDKYVGFVKKEDFSRLNDKFNCHQSLLPRFYYDESDDLEIAEINIFLADQKIFCFNKDGNLLASGYIVTGKSYTPTRKGDWEIYDKSSPEYLVGVDYRVPVSFWMPFYGGQGLHDAYWRAKLGHWEDHDNYGSHGCVNLPYYLAEFIYEHSETGTKVIIK